MYTAKYHHQCEDIPLTGVEVQMHRHPILAVDLMPKCGKCGDLFTLTSWTLSGEPIANGPKRRMKARGFKGQQMELFDR